MKKYDVMIVSGGFDPIHRGHVRMFKAAKELARVVVAGLNSDDWLVRKKGKMFMNWAERAEIVSSFKHVDEVMHFNDNDGSAMDLIMQVKSLYPNKYIAFGNGGDRNDKNTPEKAFCDHYKIDMVWELGGDKVQSSSELVQAAEKNE